MNLRLFSAVAGVLTFGVWASAQPSGSYESRAEQIEAARRDKARRLAPDPVGRIERGLLWFNENRILDKITYGVGGLRPRFGALVTGSGFAAGPEFFRDDLKNGQIRFRATTQFSTRGYQFYDVELGFPRLAGNSAFFELQATHRNFGAMQYYGPGPDSKKTGRSDYRLEDTSVGAIAGVRPFGPLRLGVTGRTVEINVGPGTEPRWTNTELLYSPAVAPGIDRQTNFLQGGTFAEIDYRDNVGGPRSGGYYTAAFTYNKDTGLERHTHRRLDMEVQQYIPFFNQRRVIALRGRSEMTWKNAGQTLPFYMQRTVGGSNDLRGFRPFRFHDDNMMVFNAEYRYEVFSGLDMAVFGDAGKVFHSKRQFNLHDLEGSYGVGMRFNARNTVFMRIDAGFSHEGFQVWVKFNNVF